VELHVTPKDFARLREWSLLPESEFLGKVYTCYPWLRDKPYGGPVKVIVDWQRPKPRRVFDNWPDGSVVKPDKPKLATPGKP